MQCQGLSTHLRRTGAQAPAVAGCRVDSCPVRRWRPAVDVVAPGLLSHARHLSPPQAAPGPAGAAGTPPPRAGKKKSKKNVDINGEVSKDLGNGMFNIKLENGVTVMAHLSGKIRQNRIKIVGGDHVTVELSPYDLTKGRITYRFRPGEYESLQNSQAQGQQS